MRTEELVRRAEQYVAAELGCVDTPVRGVMDRVHPGQGASAVRELGDARRGGQRAHGVGGQRVRDDFRPVGELRSEIVEVKLQVGGHADLPDGQATIAGEQQPRGDVRVVIEHGGDDLIARFQQPADGPGQQEVERRGVLAERDTAGVAVHERAAGHPGLGDELVGADAGLVLAFDVRVRADQVVPDGVQHPLRHLRATRPIEVSRHDALSVGPGQRRELAAHLADTQPRQDGAHDALIGAPLSQ